MNKSCTKNFLQITFGTLLILFIFVCSSVKSIAQPVLSLAPVITSGLNQPMQLVNAGDGSNRVFIVQKQGTILVYDNTFTSLGTFLTVSNVSSDGERGLLSMAFHPNYETNGFFYVFYTTNTPGAVGNLEIARYQVSGNPNVANAGSKVVLINIPHQLAGNHNGGQLHFGVDNYLYLSTGDGGGGGDPQNNAQNKSVLLGKMLRFNVNTSSIPPYYTVPPGNPFSNEIFAFGLRNPYRWSFDRLTNDMWIGDVGQNSWEEINFKPAASTLGVNYGWKCYEGNVAFELAGCPTDMSTYTFPVFTYPTVSPKSITGGVVYRGTAQPLMYGWYIAADFFSGIFYKLKSNGMGGFNTFQQTLSPTGIVNFGETEAGEVFVVSNTANSVSRLQALTFLPLKLISFTGQRQADGVQLNWTTAAEENVKGFEIEYSPDGSSFTTLDNVAALNTLEGGVYNYFHKTDLKGSIYYRLKTIDIDNSNYSYSAVVTVNMGGREEITIAPTMISDGMLNVHFNDQTGYNNLDILTVNGNAVYTENVSGRTGQFSIPVTNLPKGMYVVSLKGNANNFVTKIMIQ